MYAATVVPRESVGSWSSDSSKTTRSVGPRSSRRSTIGTPMFPPRIASWAGSAARIAWVRADVVVLPFVPVMPTVADGHSRRNRSGSQMTAGAVGSPADRRRTRSRRAARSRGSVVGKSGLMDGELVTRSAPSHACSGATSGPTSRRTVASAPTAAIARERSSRGRRSYTVTFAPAPDRKRVRAIPLRARPSTVIGRPCRAPSRIASRVSRSGSIGWPSAAPGSSVIVVTGGAGPSRGRGSRRSARR